MCVEQKVDNNSLSYWFCNKCGIYFTQKPIDVKCPECKSELCKKDDEDDKRS